MKFAEQVEAFNELVPKAAKTHEYTWCVKRQTSIPTIDLKGKECVRCSHFVLNEKGVCDPL